MTMYVMSWVGISITIGLVIIAILASSLLQLGHITVSSPTPWRVPLVLSLGRRRKKKEKKEKKKKRRRGEGGRSGGE